MIRYHRLLANRIRTKALKILAKILGTVKEEHISLRADYAALLYRSFGIDLFVRPNYGNDFIFVHKEITSPSESIVIKIS